MPTIGVTASNGRGARLYRATVEKRGASVHLLLPSARDSSEVTLEGLDALMVTGGPDVHPRSYGEALDPSAGLELDERRDALELPLLKEALERDMPVLGICRGMQLLNVAMGGTLMQDLPDHRAVRQNGRWVSSYHRVFVAPGSKLAAILGLGGFMRVNSRHHQGVREARKAPSLLASAYSLDDGLVEALESPAHSWVIGVQWHPERDREVSPQWGQFFQAFVERAEAQAFRRAR